MTKYAKIKILTEALGYYADPRAWRKLPVTPDDMKYFYEISSRDGEDIGPEKYTFCGGKRARAALKLTK